MTPQDTLRRALLNDEFPDSEAFFNNQELAGVIPDRLQFERNAAVAAWMRGVSGREVNPSAPDWQASKDALAQGFFKLSDRNVSDEQMHTLIRSHIQTAEDAATMAAEGGLTGVPLPEIVSGLRAKRGASQLRPIFNRYEQDAIRRHTALTVKLAPYRGLVNQVAGELGQEMESALPTTQKFQDVAERLLQVPEEDRPLVLQAIGATGGKDAKERASYLAKLAGAMGRMTETMGASVASATSQAGLAEAEASLIEAGQMEFAGKMETERKRQRDFDLLTQQIRSVADQEVDPIKGDGWWSQLGIDLARMVPQSAVTVANPALGMAANYAYFENTLAGEAMMRNPGMTPDQARAVAGVAAPLNAAVETVTALIPFGKVKLPFVQKWLQATATSIPTAAARAGVRTATGTAAEIGEEYLQSYIPLQAQELLKALNADMPGVDWETHMPKFSEIAAQTWGPALVYSLVGAGSVSISEVNGGRALARDTDLMVAQGLAPATAEKIAKASESNDWQQVDALFRSDFTNPQKASDTEKAEATARYLDKIKAQQSTESMNAKEAANLGVRVFRDAESWKVEMGDGSVVKADSAEAARRMRDDIRMASTEYEAETMTALVDDIINLRPQTRVEIRPEIAMATDEGIQFVDPITNKVTKINNAQSFQNLRNQAAAIDGDNRQDLAQSARLILGDNYVEFGESVARVFRSSRGKSDSVPAAITAGHEVIESSFRRGLASGLWTEQDARNAIGSLLPALESGIQRLGKKASEWEKDWLENAKKAVATGDSILIRETISEMGVRAWIGRDRDGNKTGLRPGAILRALDAAILQEQKPENVTTYQRIRAWFRAVGAYLKGVVATAKIIRDAERNGTIEDFTTFLDKVLGLEAAMREESEVTQGVKEMAFSLAPEMQSRAQPLTPAPVTEMPDGSRLVGPSTFSIRAYHGTPHKVDRFSTSKIGTGEGAQAYGWGLYFAENQSVAKEYKDTLPEKWYVVGEDDGTFTVEPYTLAAHNRTAGVGKIRGIKTQEEAEKIAAEKTQSGNLYTVELLPDSDEFLDWDKPLSEQSEKVLDLLANVAESPRDIERAIASKQGQVGQQGRRAGMAEAEIDKLRARLANVAALTGAEFYKRLAAESGGDVGASQKLANANIPGIRYLDGGSRGGGGGSYNYVIFDENLVKILEENGKPVEGASLSLAPALTAQDAEYLAAVEAGDMEKAQRMVDEAARVAGYALRYFHGSTGKEWTIFDLRRAGSAIDSGFLGRGIYLTSNKKLAERHANLGAQPGRVLDLFIQSKNPFKWGEKTLGARGVALGQKLPSQIHSDVMELAEERAKKRMLETVDDGWTSIGANPDAILEEEISKAITEVLIQLGHDGVIATDKGNIETVVFNPSQIKSADPVTYDDAGNVIPLSQRFQPESPDIRFSLSPTAGIDVVSDTLESWQGVFDAAARRNPTRAMAIREKGLRDLAKLADSYTQDRWTAKGDKIRALVEKRTKKSLDDEQAMREALRYQELMDDGMMKLTPDVLMAWSEGVGTLQDDPLIFKMLNDYGRLMSKATAEQKGLPIKDLYDDAVWLPPQFYAKNAGIMPDVMANNLGFDTASEMWAALESSIKSHRSAKEGYAKAEAAVKAVDKQAREQAKAEAAAWRQEADDMQAEDWSPRESLVRDMRTLNIILSAFPPEVRAKVTGGSMVKLAGLATERARYKAINTALQKAMEETEKFMRKEYTALVDDMLDVYRSQKDDSGRISGKLPSQYTELIDYAYRIREMDVETQATESDGLEKALEKSESDEETQRILTKLGIVRLFEVWDTKDSVAMGAASDWLSGIIESGKLGRKLLDEDRKAMLDEFRGIAKKDALPEGEISRVDVANEANNVRFKVFRRAWQGLNGMLDSAIHTLGQRLELVFGEDSAITDYFITSFIRAANESNDIKRDVNKKYHDMLSVVFNSQSKLAHARGIGQMQKVKDSGIMLTEGRVVEEVKLDIETLTKLSDGTMTAEAAGLRQDQVDDALNQWAASNRKRTVTVEVVKNAGTQKERQMTELQGIQWWLWSRQDDSRKQMERDGWTEESFKQLEEFLSPEAKALGQWIASSYDQAARMIDPVYRRLFNAPLPRVKNYAPIYRVRSGDAAVMDLDASDISSGLSAGFTKSRVNTVSPLAEMDAITVMLTHWENVAHWVTHAEAVRDAKAILLDRDVMTAVKQKSGLVSSNSIKDRIQKIETQGTTAARELHDLNRFWKWLMQYRAYKSLAFRISPVVKQTPALLNPLLADVPAHSYAVGLARAFTDPAAFGREVAAMLKSDTIMRRIEGGFSAEARIAMQGEGAIGSVALAWMQRGMMPMAWTDGGWTALGAAVSFDYYRRGYMAENPEASAEMADAYATKRLEKMIAVSAQPSDIVNRSLVEASTNNFMRSLWMFASDPRKALGIEVTAIKKLLSGKSKNKALDIQRIIVAHFAQAAVGQLMASILASFLGDDEDKEREWSREQWMLSLGIGPVNGLFVFGRAIDMVGRRILNMPVVQQAIGTGQKLPIFTNKTVFEQGVNDVWNAAIAVDDLFDPEDSGDFIGAMEALAVGGSTALSAGIGPQAGVVDVTANLLREGQKVMDAASED